MTVTHWAQAGAAFYEPAADPAFVCHHFYNQHTKICRILVYTQIIGADVCVCVSTRVHVDMKFIHKQPQNVCLHVATNMNTSADMQCTVV